MATYIKTIKPSGGDYASLTLWEAGEQTSIASGDVYVAECYTFSGGLSDGVLISGWSFADSTSRIKITVAEGHRHNGTPGSGFYILNNDLEDCIRAGEVNIDLEYLELNCNGNAKNGLDFGAGTSNSDITGNRLIIHNISGSVDGITIADAAPAEFNNCIVFNVYRAIDMSATSSVITCNNWTVYNCSSYGILRAITKNCAVFNTGSSAFLQTGTGSDYNVSSDATAPGTNKATNKTTYSDYFVGHTTGDFHLKNTSSNLWGLSGTDLSGTFTDDIDGETRSTWDIGADEYSAAGTLYFQSITGTYPYPTAVLNTAITFGSLLTGIFPSISGSVYKSTGKNIVGSFPEIVGTQVKKISISKSGIQPAPTGNTNKKISVSKTGIMPAPSGDTDKAVNMLSGISGLFPSITGAVATVLNPIIAVGVKAFSILGSSFKKFLQ